MKANNVTLDKSNYAALAECVCELEFFQTHFKNFSQITDTFILTCWVNSSLQANRIRSAVAGESNRKFPIRPDSFRAYPIESWIAKKTEEAKNSGGSPTACCHIVN